MRDRVSTARYTPDTGMAEIARRVRRAGYDGVDFNLYDFCGENGPMRRANWRELVRGVRWCLKDGGLAVGQAHAVLGVFAPDNFAFHPVLYREVLIAGARKVAEAFAAG